MKFLSLSSDKSLLHFSASYGGLEKWQEAADDAKECIRLDPSFVKGYYRLASAQMELKELDAAMATIRQGLTVDPKNPQLTKQMRNVQQMKKVAAAKEASARAPQQVSSATTMDEATARELRELQTQHAQTSREFQMVQANLVKTQREYKVGDITKSELTELPDDSKCYRSIGKMFLLSTREGVLEHLQKQMEDQKKQETDMMQKMEYLERQMKEQRQNIKELMAPTNE